MFNARKVAYVEIYIFVEVFLILALIILYYGLFEKLSFQNIITGYAVLVSLGIGILSFYYNKENLNLSKENNEKTLKLAQELNERTLKEARENNEKTLQQSEKNLLLQLLHEDRKKSLLTLLKILESNPNISSDYPHQNKVRLFLDSPESVYLPGNTKNVISEVFREIYKMNQEVPRSSPPPSDEEYEKIAKEDYEMEQQILKSKSSVEIAMDEYGKKITAQEKRLKENILSNLMNPNNEN